MSECFDHFSSFQLSFKDVKVKLKEEMYSPDKMMNGKPIHPPITASGGCFSGRYSPTYRSPDPMRRCMPNPSQQPKNWKTKNCLSIMI
ncbi:hypothetical protein Phum_PHUM425130 [Pediculus humanus corporis]|uniref:Uncharacterized protein n=1 Tax=Pediculus humanus subsp. corporis TaxID=121224 RepID=E0VT11_PEDHC|nr:uncharacterized protein Phum_PHUM425130 [Pediculus humanus corporis]EEB16517.1 hypothetical protein Phum_PHUM425130 [Pediculus humanus corporis]